MAAAGSRALVLPVRGGGEVLAREPEVPVLGGREVGGRRGGADGEARGLAQLQVEGLRAVRVARHRRAVRVPVLAVLSWTEFIELYCIQTYEDIYFILF